MTLSQRLELEHQEDLQRIRGFRLMDDDFLTKCFDGYTAGMELVLGILLERPEIKVLDVRTQVFVENLLKRSVRLDILAVDSTGARFNCEVQREDRGAAYRRARYNASMMDAHLLKKGEDFDALPETCVIFITENDVIGQGKPLYRIERCFTDTGAVFDDGSHILYVNGACRDDTPVGRLMHDFACTDPAQMHYGLLADKVRFYKENKEGITAMCKVMEDMRERSLQEGVQIGQKENQAQTARRMLARGRDSLEEIAALTGLSAAEVARLQAAPQAEE